MKVPLTLASSCLPSIDVGTAANNFKHVKTERFNYRRDSNPEPLAYFAILSLSYASDRLHDKNSIGIKMASKSLAMMKKLWIPI